MSDIDCTARRGVIFDFDGTLVDSMPTISAISRKVLLEFGMTEEEVGDTRRLVGPSFPGAFSDIYGLSTEDAKEVTARYRAIYANAGPDAWPTFEGVHEMLANLRAAGKLLGVASSKNTRMLGVAVNDNHLEDELDIICGKRIDGVDTKETSIYRVMEEFGLGPDECVMVGDRLYDVNAARACGLPCIGVLYGNTCDRSELEDAGADVIVDTVAELEALLIG